MKIDQRRLDILNYLLDYRGMNAKQMTAFIYLTPHYTISNLKQVQRDMKNLIDNKYVTKFLYDEPTIDNEGVAKTQKVSMYYLTQLGYTYMLEYYNVLQGQIGSGFLLNDDFVYGDIKYETYTPPQKLVPHHIMAINGFIEMSVGGNSIPHRNNLYAAKRFGNNRLRPDAEALINGKIYFLEFDRYTENHEKLVEKFEGYKLYFDTLNAKELIDLGCIVFVVDGDGKDRRWNNVFSAYLKCIGIYFWHIKLIMCDSNELNAILKYELHKEMINADVISEFAAMNNEVIIEKGFVIAKIIDNNKIEFLAFQHQYDSSLLLKLSLFLIEAKNRNLEVSRSLTFITIRRLKEINLNMAYYHVNSNYIELYDFYKGAHKHYMRYPDMLYYDLDDPDYY